MEIDHVEGDTNPGIDTGAFHDESSAESSDDAGTYVSDEEPGGLDSAMEPFSRKNRELCPEAQSVAPLLRHDIKTLLATGLDPTLGEEV